MTAENALEIDFNDRQIIKMLRNNPKMSQTDIAGKLKLSRPTVQKRLKELENNGVFKYSIQVNEKKMGKSIIAFILIRLDRTRRVWEFTYREILERMEELEILEFHHIAGDDDVIFKMKTRNMDSLEMNLIKITEMKGVARTRTLICLSSVEEGFSSRDLDLDRKKFHLDEVLWTMT